MRFFKKIFGNKELPVIDSYAAFWHWFKTHGQSFFKVLKKNENIDNGFLKKLTPCLQQLNEDFYCVCGMISSHTAELIITTDGAVKSFGFAEELVAAAPAIKGWKFTALKQPCSIEDLSMSMDGYEFNDRNIGFYSTCYDAYPDEIDITLVYKYFTAAHKETITSACFIYLDNLLGEYKSATLLDTVKVEGPSKEKELIPINKLQSYLLWREKEFVEKYEGLRYGTDEDRYSSLEADDENGLPVFAIVNNDLLHWDARASHPWMMLVDIKFNGQDNEGMPDDESTDIMNSFEEEILNQLPDLDGYLNIGKETYNGTRRIYIACKEFRRSSKTVSLLINRYGDKLKIIYDIFKDKYWTSVNHLTQAHF